MADRRYSAIFGSVIGRIGKGEALDNGITYSWEFELMVVMCRRSPPLVYEYGRTLVSPFVKRHAAGVFSGTGSSSDRYMTVRQVLAVYAN
jgi:hypothetical protein